MCRYVSAEEFRERLYKVFGDGYKYPFLEKEFVSTKSTITAVCPIHGTFRKKAADIAYSKTGCIRCSPIRAYYARRHGVGTSSVLKFMRNFYAYIDEKREKQDIQIMALLNMIQRKNGEFSYKSLDDVQNMEIRELYRIYESEKL